MTRFWSIKLFRIFGIQLELHLTFLLLLLVIAWQGSLDAGWRGGIWSTTAVVLIFSCVVLHELGHCLVAKRFSIPIHRIILLPIGGMALFGRIPRQPGEELLITAAGPAVNFVLAAFLLLFVGLPGTQDFLYIQYDFKGLLTLLLIFNLLMGFFNLLPVFPMDGGRLLRALFALRFSYLASTRAAVYIAKPLALTGILIALVYYNNWLTAALFAFIYVGGDMEYEQVRRSEAFRGITVRDLTRPQPTLMAHDSTLAEAVELMATIGNTEILILNDRRVQGILQRDQLAKLAERKKPDTPLGNLCPKPPTILQAEWPLDLFSDMLVRSGHDLFPVFANGVLVGTIDSRRMNEALTWHRLRQKIRHDLAHPADKPSGGQNAG